ncbi:MAG: alpha/beta hydrolase family protein [Kiritimatiellae bacterium]|nr:alpha/beta hydrolase family protein [Kiritimatiellia bacterium]MDD5521163.1 alpha/beta hydrolase family protein [Kiritimatiellia bacterium]
MQVIVIWMSLLVLASAAPQSMQDPVNLSYQNYHFQVMKDLKPELAFTEGSDVKKWQAILRAKLRELIAVPLDWDHKVEAQITHIGETDDYTHDEVTFSAEPGCNIVAYLVKPKKAKSPYPVMLCLQGHNKDGIKTSMNPEAKGGRNFALWAIRYGWAAIALEQRGYGKRAGSGCQIEAMKALMVGKHIVGERAFDVMRTIDFIETQKDLDPHRIGSMGNSSGGTTTFYAACLDPRIRLAVVSCSFCTFEQSWMERTHCPCGYIPGILKFADMPDLAGLIAPQHLLIVAGRDDTLAKLSGVQEGFTRVQTIFKAADCLNNVKLIVGEGGHDFYPAQAWPEINKIRESWK